MDNDKQRIAIAEACGWTKILTQNQTGHWMTGILPHGLDREVVPKYRTDLNAMHEAEKVLNHRHSTIYAMQLSFVVGVNEDSDTEYDEWFKMQHATAAQRAEAFLKTLKKWEDSALSKS